MRTIQFLFVLLLINVAHSWAFPFDEKNNSTSLSLFRDLNQMMAQMHERFQRLFNFKFPSFHSMNTTWHEDSKELNAVEPNCTTTTATTSNLNNRRRKFRILQTTTCTKELILNGKKQFYKETNITDDQGNLLSQSKIYQTISFNTNNETLPLNPPSENRNVISY